MRYPVTIVNRLSRYNVGRPGLTGVVLALGCAAALNCTGDLTGIDEDPTDPVASGRGFLRQDPAHPHWISFDDGSYPYLVGTTNYDLMGTPDQNIWDTIDWQAAYFNVMRVSLRPKRDLWSTLGRSPAFNMSDANPFGGTWGSPTPGWNDAYWSRFDAMMKRAAERGMIIELILCRDGHEEYDALSDGSTFDKFMAATSQHWNLIYNIANEYEENITATEVQSLANRIRAADPNRHLISVHMLGQGAYDFWNAPWSDFAAYQYIAGPGSQNQLMNSNWARNEPQVNEEYGYEGRAGIDVDEAPLRHWAIAAGGGMGFYGHSPDRLEGWYMIGAGWGAPGGAHTALGHLNAFMNSRVTFWQMRPDNAKLTSGTGWLLADPGREYLIVLPLGGTFTVDLQGVTESLPVSRLDPWTGALTALPSSEGMATSYSGSVNGFSVVHIGSRSDPLPEQPSPRIAAASGVDPDIAVSSDGTLHLAYVRQGSIYYRRGTVGGFASEVRVGDGVDPRLDLDTAGNPHIAFGTAYADGSEIRYARWSGAGFAAPIAVAAGGSFRKPRIEVDPGGAVVISYEDRGQTQRVRYVQVAPDGSVSVETIVGSDNNGGLGIAGGKYHFTWRTSGIQYSSSTGPGNSSSGVSISPAASDFSELEVSEVDGSLHVAGEVTAAGGIYYINNASGSWSAARTYAVAEVSGAAADDVNPAIAVDAAGWVYITFSGANRVPYVLLIEASGVSRIEPLDPDGGTAGGKYENPNIEEAPQGGAYAAWAASGTVYVRGLGLTN
jgi:hypothetical protein